MMPNFYIRYKYYLSCVVCLSSFLEFATGQTDQVITSNKSVYRTGDIQLLIDSARYLSNNDPNRAFDLIAVALDRSMQNHDASAEASCFLILGNINHNLEQFDLAIDYYQKTYSLLKYLDEIQVYELYSHLGNAYEKTNQWAEARSVYEEGLKLSMSKKNKEQEVQFRYNIARVYSFLGDENATLDEYKTILRIENDRENNAGIAKANDKLGGYYLDQENTAGAISSYKKSVEVARKSEDKKLESNSLRNLASAYRKSGNYNEELESRQQSLELNKQENNLKEQAEDNLEIGSNLIQQRAPAQAEAYLQESIHLSEQTGDIKSKSKAYKTLSEAFKVGGKYDQALMAYEAYAALVDSQNVKREKELHANVEMVAGLSRKLQRIDLLEKDFEINRKTVELLQREQAFNANELRIQKRIIFILLFILLILTLASVFVYRSFVARRRANLLLALKSLRSQMNPHFIFNSLNSVNNYIAHNKEKEANKYLVDFSQLMRAVLENSKHEFVPLSSELSIISLYLKLEQLRFNDKFDYELIMDSNFDTDDIEIPPMLIQPFIENAVWHGLRYRETKGWLKVEFIRTENHIKVSIQDNGIGRKMSQTMKTKHQRTEKSTGLQNAHGRIAILNEIYHTRYKVAIEDLDPLSESGTSVVLILPLGKLSKN